MIISFDLDDTLFVSPDNFKTETELRFPWNKIYKERLRFGTISLLKELQQQFQLAIIFITHDKFGYIQLHFVRKGILEDCLIIME